MFYSMLCTQNVGKLDLHSDLPSLRSSWYFPLQKRMGSCVPFLKGSQWQSWVLGFKFWPFLTNLFSASDFLLCIMRKEGKNSFSCSWRVRQISRLRGPDFPSALFTLRNAFIWQLSAPCEQLLTCGVSWSSQIPWSSWLQLLQKFRIGKHSFCHWFVCKNSFPSSLTP